MENVVEQPTCLREPAAQATITSYTSPTSHVSRYQPALQTLASRNSRTSLIVTQVKGKTSASRGSKRPPRGCHSQHRDDLAFLVRDWARHRLSSHNKPTGLGFVPLRVFVVNVTGLDRVTRRDLLIAPASHDITFSHNVSASQALTTFSRSHREIP